MAHRAGGTRPSIEAYAWPLVGLFGTAAWLLLQQAYEPGVAFGRWRISASLSTVISPGWLLFFAAPSVPVAWASVRGLVAGRWAWVARAALLLGGAVSALGPLLPVYVQFGDPFGQASQEDLDVSLNSLPWAVLLQAVLVTVVQVAERRRRGSRDVAGRETGRVSGG